MTYIRVNDLHFSYRDTPLLAGVNFSLRAGQKVALVAQNGMGKSTLLKLLKGDVVPLSGEIEIQQGLCISFLDQHVHSDPNMRVETMLYHHDHPIGELLHRYEEMLRTHDVDGGVNDNADDAMETLLHELDEKNAREYENRVKTIISMLQLGPHITKTMGMLSGGEAKRVALAKALIDEPDVLVLDEPTNHLDLEMIERLERFLAQSSLTLLMVTHDRYFLDSVCTDIYELHRGKIYMFPGNYQDYLYKKAERDALEFTHAHRLKQLRKKELAWMRTSPRGRLKKSVAREQRFDAIDDAFDASVDALKVASAKLVLAVNKRSIGDKIIKIYNLTKSYGQACLVKKFSHDFKHGERVGIVGKNGVGKSTFVHLLTKDIQPDAGTIEWGEKLVIGHYQQHDTIRHVERKVIDIVRDVAPEIKIGKETLSAKQLLERFLFTPAMQSQPAHRLSGGEKKRLQLLLVLVQNPNFLILDEPTNDLDLVTLALLEDFLMAYEGCLLVISHDRYFMDKLVDHIFAFEGDGEIYDFWGSYTDYVADRNKRLSIEKKYEKLGRKTMKGGLVMQSFVGQPTSDASNAHDVIHHNDGVHTGGNNNGNATQGDHKKPDQRQGDDYISSMNDGASHGAIPVVAPLVKKLTLAEKYEFEQLGKDIALLEKRVAEINHIFQYQTVDLNDMKRLGKEMDTIMGVLGQKEERWLELCARE